MSYDALIFRFHALQRMFERNISETDIRDVLGNGEVIETYDDPPCPSRLVLGRCGGQPIHVVASDDPQERMTVVITVYEPDPARWDSSFKHRR
ncbi:MAG: DUF4258 domain-containing protein [Phycisphaerales bacterium]